MAEKRDTGDIFKEATVAATRALAGKRDVEVTFLSDIAPERLIGLDSRKLKLPSPGQKVFQSYARLYDSS